MTDDKDRVIRKAYHTAIAIVPPEHVWVDIEKIRAKNDKAYARWPPHINLIFPFCEVDFDSQNEFWDAIEKEVARLPPFQIDLKSFSLFKGQKPTLIFLEPSAASASAISAVTRTIEANLNSELQAAQKRPFRAHMTVGQWNSAQNPADIIKRLSRDFRPVSWLCNKIHVLQRDGVEGRMTIRKSITLDGADLERTTTADNESTHTAPTKGLEIVWSPDVPYAKLRGLLALPSFTHELIKPHTGKVKLVLVLDKSGSMSGSPHTAILKGLAAVDQLIDEIPNLDISMIFFNVGTAYFGNIGKGRAIEIARTQKPGYQTNFQIAFDTVRQKTRVDRNDCVRILFMTDGCANSGNSQYGLDQFSSWARSNHCQSVVVDVLAFTTSENVDFLDNIRKSGTEEGIYRFCKSSKILSEMLNDIFDTVGVSRQRAKVSIGFNQSVLQCVGTNTSKACPEDWPISENGTEAVIDVWVSVPTGADDTEVEVNGVTQTVPVRCVGSAEKSNSNGIGLYSLILDFAERHIYQIYCRVSEGTSVSYAETEKLQDMLQFRKLFKDKSISKTERQECLERKQNVQARLDKLHELVQQGARKAMVTSNELISEMNSLRFDGVVQSARRQRQLNRRATANARCTNSIATELEKLTYVDEDLPQSEEALDFYSCMLTVENISEIMANGKDEILGFGLCVRRPEEVVDAPTLIQIVDISTSLMSRSALLDAIKYKLSVESSTSVHGGFDMRGDHGVATVGRSREPINTWLPLYVCDAHWRRVQHLIKPTLGFFCCMDPLAYDENQLWVMLMVLGTMCTRASQPSFGEREMKLMFAFSETCRAMLRSNPEFGKRVEEKLINFVDEPGARFKDSVTNLVTLVGAVLAVPEDVSKSVIENGFWPLLHLESVRRNCGVLFKHEADGSSSICRQLLGAGTENAELNAQECHDILKKIGEIIPCEDANPEQQFQGWSTQKCKMSEEAPQSNRVPVSSQPKKGIRIMLTKYGLMLQGKTPGPNIREKEEDALVAARKWWDSQERQALSYFKKAEVHLKTTHSAVSACANVLGQVARIDRIGVGNVESAQHVINLCLTSHSFDEHNPIESAQGIMPLLRKSRPPIKLSLLNALKKHSILPRDPENILKMIQCILLQCISGHSNKIARSMATRRIWADIQSQTFIQDASSPVIAQVQEDLASQRSALGRSLLIRRVAGVLISVESVDEFIGLLALGYENRDKYYNELLRTMADTSIQIPERASKVEILLSGKWDGKRVFAYGNPELPAAELSQALTEAVGFNVFNGIVAQIRSRVCVAHVYRSSDIPNRHGHCNSNPFIPCPCAACTMSTLNIYSKQQPVIGTD